MKVPKHIAERAKEERVLKAASNRKTYRNCLITFAYMNSQVAEEVNGQVIIDNNSITVEYRADDPPNIRTWHGRPIKIEGTDAPGHYTLEFPELNGKATLHQFPNGMILEGRWWEQAEWGFWKIELIK